ncbi:MAG: hypothetical protein GXP16_02160 [Gammaproteobacteria bacterium]|nr:hypothetical protein [Gammaproteobacteria bacterium]
MNRQILGRCVVAMSCMGNVCIADEATVLDDDAQSFFEYLGSMVEDGDGWLDPLDLLDVNDAQLQHMVDSEVKRDRDEEMQEPVQ